MGYTRGGGLTIMPIVQTALKSNVQDCMYAPFICKFDEDLIKINVAIIRPTFPLL